MPNWTEKHLRRAIREERSSARNYRKQGYSELAKDESRHARFLEKKLNQTKRR